MTVGTTTFRGLAVPLCGESEIKQVTLGTDILTLTGAASQTGAFINCRNSSGTSKFSVDVNGKITAAGGLAVSTGKFLNLPIVTTAVTTGIVAGDMWIELSSTAPQLGVCVSAAGNGAYYLLFTTTAPY